MPIQSTTYSFRAPLPDIIERGVSTVVEMPAYSGGSLVAPSAGTYTLYRPDETVCTTGAITVAASIATYTLPDTSSEDLGSGWRSVWSLTMPDGRIYGPRNPAYLVRSRLYPVLTDLDLTQGLYSNLDRYLPAGETSWEDHRTTAWEQIQRRLLQDQRRPWLVIEPSALLDVQREPTLPLTVRDLGAALRSKSNDRDWLGLAETHARAYNARWRELSFEYDSDDDGIDDERQVARPVLVFGAVGSDWRY